MQNRKWILTSLVMTFFGIPILAQFLAAVIAMLGAGLAAILEFCNLLFMLTLGALLLFFSGRVGNVSEFCYVGNNGVGFAVIP